MLNYDVSVFYKRLYVIVLSRPSGYTLGTTDSERVEFDDKRIK